MCWKYEWSRAVNNLTNAIIHVERARRKIHARKLRNKRTLEKLSKSKKHSGPRSLAPVKTLINKNRDAEQQCIIIIEDLKEKQNQLRHLINTYGIKMLSKKSRMAEKLMKGKRVKSMVRKSL